MKCISLTSALMTAAFVSVCERHSVSFPLPDEIDGHSSESIRDCVETNCTSKAPRFDFSEFDSLLEQHLSDRKIEGARIVIVHREYGEVHLKAFGSHSVDQVTYLASASKFISAGVLASLHDSGVFDISKLVSDYLPSDWRRPWLSHDFSTEQALSNLSGLGGSFSISGFLPFVGGLCAYLPFGTLEACAKTVYNSQFSMSRPGTMGFYGGGQWHIAGAVAQRVTGKTWDQLLEEVYIEPCKLGSFGYSRTWIPSLSLGTLRNLLRGSFYPTQFDTERASTENPSIEGGAYLDAASMGKILLMYLRGGLCEDKRIISEGTVAEMFRDRGVNIDAGAFFELSGVVEPMRYGMGFWVLNGERDNRIRHSVGFFGTVPWLDLDNGYAAALILENGQFNGYAIFQEIEPILRKVFGKQ